jgi:hypothetical protein
MPPQRGPQPSLAGRAAIASLGWIAGAIAGGYVGYSIGSHDCNGCDDPGLDQFIHGALVGGAPVAALGAAAPDFDGPCSFETRIGRSLLGSIVGTAIGFLAHSSSSKLVAVPLLSIGGATLAEWRC